MKTILEKLYDGDIYPNESIVSKDPDYRLICREAGEVRENLKKEFSKDYADRIERLGELNMQICSLESQESFFYGFKLGAKIMMEVMEDEHNES